MKKQRNIVARVRRVLSRCMPYGQAFTVDKLCILLTNAGDTGTLRTDQMQRAINTLVRQKWLHGNDRTDTIFRSQSKEQFPHKEATDEAPPEPKERPCFSEYARLPVVLGVLDVLDQDGCWVDYATIGPRITLLRPDETVTAEDVKDAVNALLNLNRIEQCGEGLRLTYPAKQRSDVVRLEELLKEEREAGAALLKRHDMLRSVIRMLVDS